MNDTYLCKAKRTDTGEWVEGYYVKFYSDGDDAVNHIIFVNYEDEKRTQPFSVDPPTVCRCTGLTDKNRKVIWENDIVKDNVIFGNVVWDKQYTQFMINDIYDGHQEYTDWWKDVEVIGNVFDNPELLEGGAADD